MIEGFLLIDKPAGITSYDVIRHIKKLVPHGAKIGHAGTLDPLATGLIIVGIGRRATKQLGSLMQLKKTYVAGAILGKEYDTEDTTGTLIKEHDASAITKKQLKTALREFRGEIKQIPPMFSALKHKGKPLYKLARKGEKVDREPRNVTVYRLKLTQFSSPDFNLRIVCSSGTYVRTIIADIGSTLLVGAAMHTLRRTKIGRYSIQKALTLDDISTEEDIYKNLDDSIKLS